MTNKIDNSTSQAATITDQQWFELYSWLLPLAKTWVWNAGVSLWQGQQQDIAEEIAQEAVMRTFHYHQRAEKGEVRPIVMLKPFGRTIAYNYFQDRRRKDWSIIPLSSSTAYTASFIKEISLVDPEQIAVERLILHSVLITLAQAIPKLPPRQKQAFLKSLVNTLVFDEYAEVFTLILTEHDIQRWNQHSRSSCGPAERRRYTALRYLAYKRLKKEMQIELQETTKL